MPKYTVSCTFSTDFTFNSEDEDYIEWLADNGLLSEDGPDKDVIHDYIRSRLEDDINEWGEPHIDNIKVEPSK